MRFDGFRLGVVGVGLGAAAGGWGIFVEPSLLWLREESVAVAGWPGAPLRVALVSDLHAGAPFSDLAKMRRVAALVAAQDPDLVLLLGDYGITEVPGGTPIPVAEWAPGFGAIPAPLGVFGVLGNHDWWDDAASIRAGLEAAGVGVLENAAVPLRSGEDTFWLVGVGDAFTEHDRVATALEAVPQGAKVLAMSHGPTVIDELGRRASLVVAGHTHGGQVYLPLFTEALLKMRWRRGLYEEGGVPLYITSGVGNSVLPIRFGVPPEVVLLTVRPG